MKILVVSEGPSELGVSPDSSSLVALANRMISQEDIDFDCRRVSDPAVHTHRQLGKHAEYEKRALLWIRLAERESFDALIFVIDQDGKKERETGIENAQIHMHFSLPRAMGVAVRSYDAWMLADEVAISSVLDRKVSRQKQPELLKNPKKDFNSLLNNDDKIGPTEIYFKVATETDLDKLAERCPKGFAPFRSRVEALAQE